MVGRGPLAANALGLGGELVVPAIQTVGGQFLDLDRGRNPGVEQVFCALHRDRVFLGLDFGEIVGDCILDDVGARAALFLSIFLFSTYVRDAGSQVAKSPQVLLPNYVAP